MEILSEWASEIIAFVLGGSAGYTLRLIITRVSASGGGAAAYQKGSGTQQTGNRVGGDMAGRDIHKKR